MKNKLNEVICQSSYDYDILNDFQQTDFIIDLFDEIEKAYLGLNSIFDKMSNKEDMILAFFPCIRFEEQIQLHYRGTSSQQKNWSQEKNLQYNLKLHKELHELYNLITKMAIVCIKKKIP